MASKKKELGIEDVSLESDGARAVLKLGDAETGPLDQAALHNLAKQIAKAIQNTY